MGICQAPQLTSTLPGRNSPPLLNSKDASQDSRLSRRRRIPPVELRLPELPSPARRDLPRQSPRAGAARESAPTLAPGFSLGASPDLRAQIEATPELHPYAMECRRIRRSRAVLLNADIDHVLGLLLLRELQPLCVYATESIRRILTEDNSMFAMLQRVPDQSTWTDFTPGREIFPLTAPHAEDSGIAMPRCLARHALSRLCFRRAADRNCPAGILARPDRRSTIGQAIRLHARLYPRSCDLRRLCSSSNPWSVLLCDGTFWSDDELIRIQGSGQTAQQMGHVPVSSANGTFVHWLQLDAAT